MKILLINYRFFLSGGPEKYMFKIIDILEKNNHEVIPFSIKSKQNQKSKYEKYFAEPIGGTDQVYFEDYKKTPKTIFQMIERQFYSFDVKKKLETLIKKTKPDVCLLMHHYNKLSPSVISACKKHKVPIVMRLSDFFMICPMALMLRNNKACDKCIEKNLFQAVKYKCVKNSKPASLIKVLAMYFHRFFQFYKKVDYIISPSQFTISKIKQIFSKSKFELIPTFIETKNKYNSTIGKYALFVGRIEEEKGVMVAIKAFENTKYTLKIIGKSSTKYDIIVKEYIQKNNLKNVEYLGPKYGKELETIYKRSRFFIMPSVWYENMPNVVLEAMSHSKPVLASDIGSLKEIVQNESNGYLFKVGDHNDLRNKAEKLFSSDKLIEKLGKNAYNKVINEYNSQKHYNKLIRTFNQAIKESN